MEPTANEADADWRVVGPSWSSVRAAFLSMKPLFFSAALAMLALSAFSFYGPGLIGAQSRVTASLSQLAVDLCALLLQLLILAPVAVAVHRFVLLGERTPGIISLTPSYTRRFALWLILTSLIAFVVIFVVAGLGAILAFGSMGKLLTFVSLVALSVCLVFTVLIFPAIAIEEPSSGWKDRLLASWRRMDGHFWIFFGVSLVTIFPVILVVTMIAGAAGIVDVVFPNFPYQRLLDFGLRAIKDLAQILTAMLGAAVASRFYGRFRDQIFTPVA